MLWQVVSTRAVAVPSGIGVGLTSGIRFAVGIAWQRSLSRYSHAIVTVTF